MARIGWDIALIPHPNPKIKEIYPLGFAVCSEGLKKEDCIHIAITKSGICPIIIRQDCLSAAAL